jgi:flagellar biosynthesis protein FlhF
MSNVQIFRAASTQEAYSLVRSAFGNEAIILRTRRRKAGWWPWRRYSHVEVEAMSDDSPAGEGSESAVAESDDPAIPDVQELRNQARAAQLERMISQLACGSSRDSDAIPAELFQTFANLLDAGVEHSDARELIMSVSQDRGSSPRGEQVRSRMREALLASLNCQGPIQCRQGSRHVVALVGPTGVGKTTTIAKLASNFHLQDGLRVGLVTTDTFRSAAVDQLRTYSQALGLPLEVAGSAEELQIALARLHDRELVLIDTAGRSPRDEPRLNELRGLLRGSPINEVQLVLSLTTSPATMADLAEQFRTIGPMGLLLTKLDEAPGAGTIYSATRRVSCALSYITTGQTVPDDIEIADPQRIVNMLLRDERLAHVCSPAHQEPAAFSASQAPP